MAVASFLRLTESPVGELARRFRIWITDSAGAQWGRARYGGLVRQGGLVKMQKM